MKRTALILAVVAACALLPAAAAADIKLGMLAQRGVDNAYKEWGALATYLGEQLGEKVVLIPLKFSEVVDFVNVERSGFMFTNPWFFVRAKVLKGAKPLVTVKYKGSGAVMGGVIFARADSPVVKIEDLRNKVLMCPKLSSPGGWLFAKGEIMKKGIIPEKDCRKLIETEKESHDEVVLAVRDKKADVGTVRTNLLETMHREQKIDLADFRVIEPMQHPDFPELCSTPLYPDWPVFALKDTPQETIDRMKAVLLTIPAGHPALEQARRIERFIDALDYEPVEELCRFLKVEPFRRMR